MLSITDFKEKHLVFVFAKDGQHLSFKNDNLIVTNADNEIELQLTCYRVFAVWIVGSITLTSGILERSKKFGFSIALFTYGFRSYGQWNAATEGNFLLRIKQYNYTDIAMARQIIVNKISNQVNQLKSIRKKSTSCKETIKILDGYQVKANNVDSFESLLGLEGNASKLYFLEWFGDNGWNGRKPRAKLDINNVLLDIGYTMLFCILEGMLNLYGFDIYKGVYHKNFYHRKSLVCDVIEPFRVIVDRIIKNAHGLGQINEHDFIIVNGQYQLKYNKSKEYSRFILKGLLEFKEPMFEYVQQFYRVFIGRKSTLNFPIFDFGSKQTTKNEDISNL